MPGSTCRWNRAACAWWMRRARSCAKPRWRASRRPLLRPTQRVGDAIGLEAGPLSQWLHAGLSEAGLETVLLETRHVKAALSAMIVKTDRKDARGIAQLLRMGWFRPVHRRPPPPRESAHPPPGRSPRRARPGDAELACAGVCGAC